MRACHLVGGESSHGTSRASLLSRRWLTATTLSSIKGYLVRDLQLELVWFAKELTDRRLEVTQVTALNLYAVLVAGLVLASVYLADGLNFSDTYVHALGGYIPHNNTGIHCVVAEGVLRELSLDNIE